MPSIVSKFVEVCIFKFERDRALYLLLHRSKDEKIYPNIWQFVSGTMETDEPAKAAALRELREETGFEPRAFWALPYINSFYDPDYDSVNLDPMFAAQVDAGSEPKLSSEHDEYKWCGLDDALRTLTWHGQREALRIVQNSIVSGGEGLKHLRLK